ncbi:MAG: MerR family transcriptional regulator [Micromonosporaceae bacterium]
MKSRKSRLRTVDVARLAGYSVQQVRNLEHDGVLPPATRTRAGYRVYGTAHVQAAMAYRMLAVGVGPVEAKRIMRAAHRYPASDLLDLLDAGHARLHAERRGLALAREATGAIAAESIDAPRPSDSMGVSELADALGVRASTLRHWDAEGLVVPHRVRRARRYSPNDVRDARIVQQLRMAGYRIGALKALMPQLQQMRQRDEVLSTLAARDASITSRSRALLQAASALNGLIDASEPRSRS